MGNLYTITALLLIEQNFYAFQNIITMYFPQFQCLVGNSKSNICENIIVNFHHIVDS